MLLRFITVAAIFSTQYLVSAQVDLEPDELVEQITLELQQKLGQILPVLLINKIQESIAEPLQILPDLPDPLFLNDFGVKIPQDSEIGEQIYGELSVCDARITGLSTLDDWIDLYIGPLAVKYSINLDYLSFSGRHDVSFTIYSGDYVTTGSGAVRINMDVISLSFKIVPVIFQPWNRITIGDLEIEFNFSALNLYGQDFTVNGQLFAWDEINTKLKPTFDALWPGFKPILEEVVKNELNNILLGCKVFDMLNEVFDCFSANRTQGVIERAIYSLEVSKSANLCPPV